jgi:hypothetical protein
MTYRQADATLILEVLCIQLPPLLLNWHISATCFMQQVSLAPQLAGLFSRTLDHGLISAPPHHQGTCLVTAVPLRNDVIGKH